MQSSYKETKIIFKKTGQKDDIENNILMHNTTDRLQHSFLPCNNLRGQK